MSRMSCALHRAALLMPPSPSNTSLFDGLTVLFVDYALVFFLFLLLFLFIVAAIVLLVSSGGGIRSGGVIRSVGLPE